MLRGQLDRFEDWSGSAITWGVLLDLIGVDVIVIGVLFIVFIIQISDFLFLFRIEVSPHFLLDI